MAQTEKKQGLGEIPTNSFLGLVFEALEDPSFSLSELISLKKEMVRRNFNAPFAFLLFAALKQDEDLSKKEAKERSKQLNYFRKIATMKKYALFSAKMAISARKIAMLSKGNGYDDLVQFLPLNGNYLKNIFASGTAGTEIYREFLDKIKESGVYEDAVDYTIQGLNYTFKKTLFASKQIKLMENEKIISRKKTAKIRPIFKSSFVAKALLSAIIGYANEVIKKNFFEEDESLIKYNRIIHGFGYVPYSNISHFLEKDKPLFRELENAGFLKNKKLDEELIQKLREKREEIKKQMMRLCSLMLVIPIAKHYLLKNKGERAKSQVFPSLPVNPAIQQISFFKIIDKEAGFNIIELLKRKFEIEDYGNNAKISEGLLANIANEEIASKFFKKSISEIKTSADYAKSIKAGKGREFLDKVKKGKN